MSDLPRSIWSGSFIVHGIKIECHVMSDGRRIVEADSMRKFIEAMDRLTVINAAQLESDLAEVELWMGSGTA